MRILVINCGSSSVKFKLFHTARDQYKVLAGGLVEKIAESDSRLRIHWQGGELERERPVATHHEALEIIEALLVEKKIVGDFSALDVIAHRVVHGGEKFRRPVVVDDEVTQTIRELIPLAPLHNPFNLDGIMALRRKAPRVKQVAVFDTAFHQTMPEAAFRYPLPEEFYREKNIRRYGFHGISHNYLVKAAGHFLGQPLDSLNIITLHLGNGASAAAVSRGRCIDTSMGMTPLAGLVMGTRCGDLDPGILVYLEREYGFDANGIDAVLNNRSGLKGLCGENDVREILQRIGKGDASADLALEIFCRRIKKYIGAYTALLGGLDVLVFSGGIGAGSAVVREKVCAGLEYLGIELDIEANKRLDSEIGCIDDGRKKVRVLAMVTDEELEMARQVVALTKA